MKRIATTIARWLLFTVTFSFGFLGFLSLCGDSETVGFGTFFIWKAGSIAAIAAAILAGRAFYRRGLFPGIVQHELKRALREKA